MGWWEILALAGGALLAAALGTWPLWRERERRRQARDATWKLEIYDEATGTWSAKGERVDVTDTIEIDLEQDGPRKPSVMDQIEKLLGMEPPPDMPVSGSVVFTTGAPVAGVAPGGPAPVSGAGIFRTGPHFNPGAVWGAPGWRPGAGAQAATGGLLAGQSPLDAAAKHCTAIDSSPGFGPPPGFDITAESLDQNEDVIEIDISDIAAPREDE